MNGEREAYRDGNFIRWKSPQWEIDIHGEAGDSKGDLIFNNCYRIVKEKDTSSFAKVTILECADLLRERKRWPDRMNQDFDAKNKLDQWNGTRRWKNGERKYKPGRSQKNMTRDPYIAFYAAAILNEMYWLVGWVRIPFHLFTPSVWERTRRLRIDARKWFVKRLDYLQALSTVMIFEHQKDDQEHESDT